MKRLSIAAAAVCLLWVAVPAEAGTSRYRGDVDPSGRLRFKVVKAHGTQRVSKLKWAKLPVRCNGKRETTSNGLNFRIRVKDGAFDAEAVLGKTSDPDAKAEVHGELRGHRATGTIEVKGKRLPLDGGVTGDCRSGELDWSAGR